MPSDDAPANRDAPPSEPAGDDSIDLHDPRVVACIDRYWRKNVTIMGALLVLWAAAGLGCGVLFADALNAVTLAGFPLGFWFAQQGSIVVFVAIVLLYALLLNRLDARHHEDLVRLRAERTGGR